MAQTNPQAIKQLLNEGTPQSIADSRLSLSYKAVVTAQLTRYFAGKPIQPGDDEFDLMAADWTSILQDAVPEYRLAEVFENVRRNRTTTFALEPSEIRAEWDRMKIAEKSLRPTDVPVFAKDVCKQCNGTGTRTFKKFDSVLGREYTYGEECDHK